MAIRFYKKLTPGNPVQLENIDPGKIVAVQFDTLDGLLGYYATDVEALQNGFAAHMRAQRSGITEISEQEFTENFVKKKQQAAVAQPPKAWREEMSGSSGARSQGQDLVARLGSERVLGAVAVSGSDIRRPGLAITEVQTVQTTPAEKPVLKPVIGKRKPLRT